MRVTQRRAVGGHADDQRRDDEFARRARFERHAARARAAERPPTLVVVLDRGQACGRTSASGDACGDTAAGDADAVAYEQVAVAAGDVVEVDVVVERAGDGAHISGGCRPSTG